MRILLVDDDAMAGELTSAVLEDAGYDVVLAENGVEAMERLSDDPAIALVVSDMNMPLVTGIDLFRSLREDGVTIPFILLTGDDPEPLRREEPNLDGCLIKDSSLDETLVSAISTALARRTGS